MYAFCPARVSGQALSPPGAAPWPRVGGCPEVCGGGGGKNCPEHISCPEAFAADGFSKQGLVFVTLVKPVDERGMTDGWVPSHPVLRVVPKIIPLGGQGQAAYLQSGPADNAGRFPWAETGRLWFNASPPCWGPCRGRNSPVGRRPDCVAVAFAAGRRTSCRWWRDR